MTANVLIKDILEGLELQGEESPAYLDLETGKIAYIDSVLRHRAESAEDGEEPDLPEWQLPEWELAKRFVATPDSFRILPNKFDIHEWSIMEDFSRRFPSEAIGRELMDAIHGKGAFRNFQSTIRRHKLESAWDEFYDAALRQIAVDWCEENKIPYA
jgi:hypothetical protein